MCVHVCVCVGHQYRGVQRSDDSLSELVFPFTTWVRELELRVSGSFSIHFFYVHLVFGLCEGAGFIRICVTDQRVVSCHVSGGN